MTYNPVSTSSPYRHISWRRGLSFGAAFSFLALLAGPLTAQNPVGSSRVQPPDSVQGVEFPTIFALDPVVVTATRSARTIFEVPQPVARIDANLLRVNAANNVADLFRNLQGLDVVGVGPSQVRPAIRGQRGQRILLLSDGLRLQNSRRQQDFGEIPALTDVSAVERVEVVRGPSSVLYGSDAIGGVVNIVTRRPAQEGTHGSFAYRYGSAGTNNKGALNLWGRYGKLDVKVGGSYQSANAYTAPSGSFGKITLDDDVTVLGTGVTDWSGDAYLGWSFNENNRIFGTWEHYDSEDAGFGFVDPSAYSPGDPTINIRYPEQKFDKFSLGYEGTNLDFALADALDVIAYGQKNDRDLVFDFDLSFPTGPSSMGRIHIVDTNQTEISTYGFRVEAKKLTFDRLMWTYGVDFFRDSAEGTDLSVSEMIGFGPFPIVETDSTPSLPKANLQSLGVFAQADYEWAWGGLIAGGRYQRAGSETFETPGLPGAELYDQSDDTFVGALNAVVNASDHISLVGTLGRGFRWPNLVERYFEGSTPEGSGDQLANPDLNPEKSLNWDLGFRYRRTRVAFETFYFHNTISDAIRVALVGEGDPGQGIRPTYQNVNIDEFLYQGVEVVGELFFLPELGLFANYTWLDSENKTNPELPVAEGAANKLNLALQWMDGEGRWWARYDFRTQGDQADAILGENPIGETLPGFSVHNIRLGFRFFAGGFENRLDLSLNNLTDELYAEASNSTFFRPEPGRSVFLTLSTAF